MQTLFSHQPQLKDPQWRDARGHGRSEYGSTLNLLPPFFSPAPVIMSTPALETVLCSMILQYTVEWGRVTEGVHFPVKFISAWLVHLFPAPVPPINSVHLLSVSLVARTVGRYENQPSASNRTMKQYLLRQDN